MPIHPQMYDIETLDKVEGRVDAGRHPPNAVLINLAPQQGRRHIETQEELTQLDSRFARLSLFPRGAW